MRPRFSSSTTRQISGRRSPRYSQAGLCNPRSDDGAAAVVLSRRNSRSDLHRLENARYEGRRGSAICPGRPSFGNLPVIVITAFGSSHSAIEAVRLGAYDFVTKPFDLEEIALTAERALAHSSLNRELTASRPSLGPWGRRAADRLEWSDDGRIQDDR